MPTETSSVIDKRILTRAMGQALFATNGTLPLASVVHKPLV